MKRLYKLKPKTKILNDFYVFDTETGYIENNKIHYKLNARPESFIFGVVYGHNYTRVIYSVEDFITEFKDLRYKNKKVFAHNAEYDLNVLYGNIYDLDAEAIFNGKFICATNGNCQFADSMNIYPASIKKIGELLGKEKQQLGNHKLISPLTKDGKINPKDINYCIRDCEIAYEALISIFEDAGDIKITQASLSLTYYRRHFQPFTIDHNDYTKYFWESYYGGRTEAFKIGTTHASVIDVNSMYPNAMKQSKFPNPKYLRKENYISPSRFLNNILPHFYGCIKCTVIHKDNWVGLLPFKNKSKLLFPTGKFTGCWNFNEIYYALKTGLVNIKSIEYVVYSEPMESIFSEYVNDLYNKRLVTTNDFERYRLKIYMNSLYGKFAQRIDRESIYLDDIEKHIDLIQEHQRKGTFIKLDIFNAERSDAFLVVKNKKNYGTTYSIPSFSSYITSFARIQLLDKLIEFKPYNPVYCDTDSIFYETENLEFVDSKKLGEWGKENKIVTEIRGLKNYSYLENDKEIKKIKGVPKNATEGLENTFKYSNLVRTRESLRRNIESGVLIERTKIIKNTYDKRIVLSDGNTLTIKI